MNRMKIFLTVFLGIIISFQINAQQNVNIVKGETVEEIMNSAMELSQELDKKGQRDLTQSIFLIVNYYDSKNDEIQKYGLDNGFSNSEIEKFEIGVMFLGKTAHEIIRQGKECFYILMENKNAKDLEEIKDTEERIVKLIKDSIYYEETLKDQLEKIQIVDKNIQIDSSRTYSNGVRQYIQSIELTIDNKSKIPNLKGIMIKYKIATKDGQIFRSERGVDILLEQDDNLTKKLIYLNNSYGKQVGLSDSYTWEEFEELTGYEFSYSLTNTSVDGNLYYSVEYTKSLHNARMRLKRQKEDFKSKASASWNNMLKH